MLRYGDRIRVLAAHAAALPDPDRERIEAAAVDLVTGVKKRQARARFSDAAALEALWAIGRLYREPWRRRP